MTRTTVASFALVALAACTPGGADAEPTGSAETETVAPAPEPEPEPEHAAPTREAFEHESVLVWRRGDQGSYETLWLSRRGSSYAIEDRVEGVVLAAGDHVYRFESQSHPFTVPSCSVDDEDWEKPGPPKTFIEHLASVDEVGGDRRVVLSEPYDSDQGWRLGDYEDEIVPTASFGRWLIVEASVSDYGCGAHGNYMSQMIAVDLATGEERPLMSKADEARVTKNAWPQAKTQFELEDEDWEMFVESSAPMPAGLSTVWMHRTETEVGLVAQLTVDSCYACSDGDWSAYTVSQQVPVSRGQLPDDLAAELALPELLQEYLWHNDVPERGWGFTVVTPGTAAGATVAEIFGGRDEARG